MKKYTAKTNVSVNVILSNGKNLHVSFSPLTGGGSVYYTDNADIQKALESHYKFGKLFKLDEAYEREKKGNGNNRGNSSAVDGQMAEHVCAKGNELQDLTSEPEEDAGHTIVVSDPDEAKDYLCDHFGLSRTKIKGLKAIKEAAAERGINFKGLD